MMIPLFNEALSANAECEVGSNSAVKSRPPFRNASKGVARKLPVGQVFSPIVQSSRSSTSS